MSIPLSPRERQVADLVAQGYTNIAIARRLGISPQTVKNHISNIYAKLELQDTHTHPRVVLALRWKGKQREKMEENPGGNKVVGGRL